MKIPNKGFERTLAFGELMGLQKNILFGWISNIRHTENTKYTDTLKSTVDISEIKPLYFEMLEEITAIEMEKLKLKGDKNELQELWTKELFYNKERGNLFQRSFDKWHKLLFQINPCISFYESDWQWVVSEKFMKSYNLESFMNLPRADCYFLFEKTGTFDAHLQSNILEYSISEYQYFLLQLFESPNLLGTNLSRFYEAFEFDTVEEKKILIETTQNLIEEMIFKRWLIISV